VLVLPEFFDSGLTLLQMSNAPASLLSFAYLQKTNGLFSLDIGAPEQMLVDASLFDAKGRELEQYSFASHIDPTSWRLVLAPPAAGRGKVHIFAARTTQARTIDKLRKYSPVCCNSNSRQTASGQGRRRLQGYSSALPENLWTIP